ncbi:MAG: hypothetical protein KDK27_14550, partial [Leptospiraceae bacterium]|nr:hypothetical protein [Leptospiraceae bacterium]
MEFFLIAISFLGSVGFTLALRRLDKSGWKNAQLKRLGETREQQLEELAEKNVQSIRDAVLDYEMLIRQGRQNRESLESFLKEYEERMEAIRDDRDFIEKIHEELGGVAGSANQVAEQVENLDRGLERLALAEKDIDGLTTAVDDLVERLEDKGQQAESTLSDVVQRLISETENRTEELTENVRSSFQVLQDEFKQLDLRMDDQTRDMDLMGERIAGMANRVEEKWLSESGHLEERLSDLEKRLSDRIVSMESGLSGIRTKAVEQMQTEIKRIRDDMDDFNLTTITKRDEILNETRRMAENIKDEMQIFQENYLAAENKLIKDAEQYHADMRKRLADYEQDWLTKEQERTNRLKERFSALENEMAALRKEEHDGLGMEATRLREDLRQLGQNLGNQLDTQLMKAQESLREIVREEEESLQHARDELSQMKDNLGYLGQELKAALRTETDHS